MENLDKFLAELSALTQKHNISIHGCGCCGSPYLAETTQHDNMKYITDEYGNTYIDNLRYREIES